MEDRKNNPSGKPLNQEALLAIIKKQKFQLDCQNKKIVRLEKDVDRYKREISRLENLNVMMEADLGYFKTADYNQNDSLVVPNQQQVMSQFLVNDSSKGSTMVNSGCKTSTQVTPIENNKYSKLCWNNDESILNSGNERNFSFQTQPTYGGLTDPKEIFEELKSDMNYRLDQLRKENQNQRMTIKRYRQILNETLKFSDTKKSTIGGAKDDNESVSNEKQSIEHHHAAKERETRRELSSNAGDLIKESALDDYISVISPNKQATSKQSKHQQPVLQTKFDFHRMSLLFKLVHEVIEAKHVSESFVAIMKQVQEVINCSSCCFFVFGNRIFSEHDKKKLTI